MKVKTAKLLFKAELITIILIENHFMKSLRDVKARTILIEIKKKKHSDDGTSYNLVLM